MVSRQFHHLHVLIRPKVPSRQYLRQHDVRLRCQHHLRALRQLHRQAHRHQKDLHLLLLHQHFRDISDLPVLDFDGGRHDKVGNASSPHHRCLRDHDGVSSVLHGHFRDIPSSGPSGCNEVVQYSVQRPYHNGPNGG